jgi:uncharacterized protein
VRTMFAEKANAPEITRAQFWTALLVALPGLTIVFGFVADKWTGMAVVMGAALAGAALLASVRRRLKLSILYVVSGLVAGAALYGLSLLGLALLSRVWPGWETHARTLYAWRVGHSPLFIGITLVMIVLAEEVLWRGVVARYLMERHGTGAGIFYAAVIYALAHAATLNPALLLAALGCGAYWGFLYAATDDLVTPTVAHLLWDILLLFLFPVVR